MYKICKYGKVNEYVVSVNTKNGVTTVVHCPAFKDGTSFENHKAVCLCEELNEIYSNYGVVFGGCE
jgi:hypothetical protein